jgi:hypothetical protein
MHSSNLLFPISAWDGLSLGPTDDAVYADVHLGTNEDAFDNALSTYTSPIDSNTYNFDETFTPDNSFDSSLLLNWGLLTMPKLTRNLCATGTALDSSNQREPSESATAQTISSTPMTQLPSWTLNSQTFEVIPNENALEQPASITNTQRRKTKMKPGTRPCDLKLVKQTYHSEFIVILTGITEDRSEKRTGQRNVTSAKRDINGGVIWKDTTALITQMRLPRWDLVCLDLCADTAVKTSRGVII